TAWQRAFRQGSPQDARQVEALFGQAWIKDEAWRSDGMTTTRLVERPRVSTDEWMNALEPGDAWLRVAPIDKGWRQVRVRVALPTRIQSSDTDSDTKPGAIRRVYPRGVSDPASVASDVPGLPAAAAERSAAALPPVPPDCP